MSTHYKEVENLPKLPVDHLQGLSSCGTPAFSNEEPANPPADFERFCSDQHWGAAHQCVCFARRMLWNRFSFILPDISIANQIFYIPYVFDANLQRQPVKAIRNGGAERPQKGALVIYASHWHPTRESNFPGHVAVVDDVTDDTVFIADQNRFSHHWGGKTYSASFPLRHDKVKGSFTIVDEKEPIVGWVQFPTAKDELNGDDEAWKSRREQKLEASPQVYPRGDKTVGLNKNPAMRPMPQNVLDNFPKYDSTFLRWSWWSVLQDFRPTPLLFPFVFAFMVMKFLVWYPIKTQIRRLTGF